MSQSSPVSAAPFLECAQLLLEVRHSASLRALVESLPEKILVKEFKRYVQIPRRTASERAQRTAYLFNKSHDRVRAKDLLENLDRLREHEPKFLEMLIHLWINVDKERLSALADRSIDVEEVHPQFLLIAQALLSDATTEIQQALLARLTRTEEQLHEAELVNAKLKEEVERYETASVSSRLEELEDEVRAERLEKVQAFERHESQLREQREALEAKSEQTLVQELQTLRETHERALADLTAKHEAERQTLAAELSAEKESRRAEQLAHQGELERERNAYRQEFDKQVKAVADLESKLERHEREYGADRAALDRVTDDYEALDEVHQELKRAYERLEDSAANSEEEANGARALAESLRRELNEERAITSDQNLTSVIDRALVIPYARLGRAPAERLAELFTLYEAFTAGERRTEALVRLTNIGDFADRKPEGIVVTDMERLLKDGAELALTTLLRLKTLRQESILKQLRERSSAEQQELD